MASNVFSLYTPDVPSNAPTPCMRDPIRMFDVVFILSIVFWLPCKWWKRGSHLHDAWVASVIAILVVHLVWLMTANAAGQPSEDTWEYPTAVIAFMLALAGKHVVASCIPYLVPIITGFYGLQFVYSLNVTEKPVMTALLALLLAVSLATFPITIYLLKSTAAKWVKNLLDLAFRTVLMVTGIKFLVLQDAESNGVICCTISRDWQLTTNCPLSVSITLLFVCVGALGIRIAIEACIWKRKQQQQQGKGDKMSESPLINNNKKDDENEEEGGDSSAE